jgi:adenylosuccinate synthase
MKAYTTRVGGGPFPTELTDAVGEGIRERGREFGATTGRPRRCGWLDFVACRYAVRVNGVDAIAMTKLDVLSGVETVRACVAYEVGGKRTEALPASARALSAAKPVYEEFAGWSASVGDARTPGDLPAAARAYVEAVSQRLGVPVAMVSVGPERSQLLRMDG